MVMEPASDGSAGLPRLVGGALCLDFVNTVDPRHATDRWDYLTDYAAFLDWSTYAGGIQGSEARRLGRAALGRDSAITEIMNRVLHLRESLYRLFASIAERRPLPRGALESLNAELAEAQANAEIVHSRGGFTWGWSADPLRLDRALWPIARSAADLLVAGDLERIRECPGDG